MMDTSSPQIPDGNFTILTVTDEIPLMVEKLSRTGKARVLHAGTKSEAADLIGTQQFDLLVIQENDDWNEVKELMGLAAAGEVGAIIVQGRGLGDLEHLRAILGGADRYAPQGEEEWTFDQQLLSSEKPANKLGRELTDVLLPYGSGLAAKLLDYITDSSASPGTVDVAGVVRRAARQVSDVMSEAITAETVPRIRKMLKETRLEVTGAVTTESSQPSEDETEPYLYWNWRFPDHPNILANEPCVVQAGSTYPFETAIEPTTGPEGTAKAIPAEQLADKKINFILKAANGQFRVGPKEDWHPLVLSETMDCSEGGTIPFRIDYRPSEPGTAEIELTLVVNGGSISQHVIEMSVIGPGTSIPNAVAARASGIPLPGHSLLEAPGTDFLLYLKDDAALFKNAGDTVAARWYGNQPERGAVVASVKAYEQLSDLSKQFTPASGMKLLGVDDGNLVLLKLARIGSKLYRTLFEDWGTGEPPAELKEIADRLRNGGDISNPSQLEIVADGVPVPWGILYDGEPVGLDTSPKNIHPDRFWGMRFDIYRHAESLSPVPPSRGVRCVVKPIVGKTVPRSAQQLSFVANLANQTAYVPEVRTAAQTPEDLLTWAACDDDNDLLYFYCHAVPDENALVFGPTEQDPARVSLSELTKRWGQARNRYPVVILNACSSGQTDAINGRPFVDFFMRKWGAQAFIGTDWPVQAILADAIGQQLLFEIITERLSLRQALRAVISAGVAKGNYFPLMYAVYGPSNVRFAATSTFDSL